MNHMVTGSVLSIDTETGRVEEYTGEIYYDERQGTEFEIGLDIGSVISEDTAVEYDETNAWVGNVVVLRDTVSTEILRSGIVQHMDVIDESLLVMAELPDVVPVEELPEQVKQTIQTE